MKKQLLLVALLSAGMSSFNTQARLWGKIKDEEENVRSKISNAANDLANAAKAAFNNLSSNMQNSNVSKKLKEKAKRFGAALTTLSSSMKQHMEHAKQVAENTKVGQALKSDVEATVKEAKAGIEKIRAKINELIQSSDGQAVMNAPHDAMQELKHVALGAQQAGQNMFNHIETLLGRDGAGQQNHLIGRDGAGQQWSPEKLEKYNLENSELSN
jgi:hypothetical protein